MVKRKNSNREASPHLFDIRILLRIQIRRRLLRPGFTLKSPLYPFKWMDRDGIVARCFQLGDIV